MAINWDEIDKKAKKIDQQNDAKRRAQASAAQQRAMIAPKPSKATTANAPYVGASASGTGFGFDPLAKKDKSKKPNLVGIDPYLIDSRRGERIGRTLLGATESSLGTSINVLDVTSKTPILNPSLYLLRRYNDIFAPDATGKAVDYLMGKSEKNISKAKEGLGSIGKVAVDVGVGATQLAGDIGLAAATGGSSLIPMAVRSFGGSAYEAEKAGASLGQQIAYGGLSAATSLLVEKISNAGKILGKAYGKGATDEVLEKGLNKAIGKLIKNDAVSSRISTALAAGAGEGVEEMIESTLSPIYQKITYNPDAKYDADTVADILYDGLIGAIIGGLAGGLGGANADAKQQVDNTQAKVDSLSDFKTTANQNTTSQQGISSPIEVVNNILSKPVTNAEAESVINTPALKTAFETLTGQQIQGTKSEQRAQVKQSQQVVQTPTINPNIQQVQDTQINQTNATAQQALPQGTGAMSPEFAYQEKINQQHSTDNAFTEAERQMQGLRHEDSTHQVVTDKAAIAQAEQRLAFDFDGEKADLAKKQDWDKADTTAAHIILRKLTDSARETGDYSEVVKWNKTLESQKSAQGQALQANAQFANSPESIVAKAAETMLSDSTKGISQKEKTAIIDNVADLAYKFDSAKGDSASLIEIVKESSELRKTQYGDKIEDMLIRNGELDPQWLESLAARSISSIASDYAKPTSAVEGINKFLRRVKSNVITNQLSRFTTWMANFVSNGASVLTEPAANNMPTTFIADAIMSKFTGIKTHGWEWGMFSKESQLKGRELAEKSWCETWLDVNASGTESKYTRSGTREYKMTGKGLSPLASMTDAVMGVALNTTDQLAAGWQYGSVEKSLQKQVDKGKLTKAQVAEIAQIRADDTTFHNKTMLGNALTKTQQGLNLGMEYGAGNIVMGNYLNVPASVSTRLVEYMPHSFFPSMVGVARVCVEAKTGVKPGKNIADIMTGDRTTLAQRQARSAQKLGRASVGMTGLVGFTAMALKGFIRRFDDDDDRDKAALEAAEGLSGTLMNMSAILRGTGKDGEAEWRKGDVTVNISRLEPFISNANLGIEIADAIKEDGILTFDEIKKANIDAIEQSVYDLSMFQNMNSFFKALQYKDEEESASSVIGKEVIKNNMTSLVPGFVQQFAKAQDPYYRELFSGDTFAERATDAFKSTVPGLRQTLPMKLTGLGEPKKYADNEILRWTNAMLNPYTIDTYRQNDVVAELKKLEEAGADVKYPSRKMVDKLSHGDTEFELNAEQRAKYHETSRKLVSDYMNAAIKDSQYKKMTDAEKAKFLSDMQNYALDVAKRDFFTQKGVEYSSDYNEVANAQEMGIKPTDYFQYKYALKRERPEGGNPTQLQFSSAINTLKLSNEDKGKLWDIENQKYSEKNPFTGTLAQYGLPPEYTIEIMRAFKQIEQDLDDYEKPEKGPSKAHVQAAYFRQWLISRGFNWGEVAAIEDVFITWQSIPVTKPSKKAQYYVATNPK